MDNVVSLHPDVRGADQHLLNIVQPAIEQAAEQAGPAGVQAFFDGYKDDPSLLLKAA